MERPIVATKQHVTLVGGGDLAAGDLAQALSLAPVLVAADSGADAALSQGHAPQAVIGDFDSISRAALRQVPAERLHRIAEQESTDFDKALRNISAPLVLAVGFLGGRLDHQLSVLNTLARRAAQSCVLVGGGQVIFAAPPRLELPLCDGDVVSLFPMSRVTGRSRGLVWPIDGLVLEPKGRVGTSNRAEGPVTLETDQPGLLVILPERSLPGAIAALVDLSKRWPAASSDQAAHT